jgi:hypothetical protein
LISFKSQLFVQHEIVQRKTAVLDFFAKLKYFTIRAELNRSAASQKLFEKSKLLPEPPSSSPIWGALRFKVPQIGGLRGQMQQI